MSIVLSWRFGEASEVDTKSKRAVFLPNKEDWSSMERARGMDEPCSKVLINELTQSCKFLLGQGVNGAKRRGGAFIQCDFEIIGLMVG